MVGWINRALESLWLVTVVLVPLAFLGRNYGEWSSIIGSFELPKIVTLRTLVGLMVGLWVIEWGIKGQLPFALRFSRESSWARPGQWVRRLGNWVRGDPTGWLKLAVVLFLGSTLLSTVLSASFNVSMWGDVPGQASYSAYTVVAYVLLFAVIATHLKSEAQLWRLLVAMVTVGVLVAGYAMFQQYGHDFLNLIEPPNTLRVSSTLGNATFAASVMLITIPLSLAAATLSLSGSWKLPGSWWKLGLWIAILTVQLLGLSFTLSRGPWLGTAIALAGIPQIKPTFLEIAPSGIPSNIIPHSKGVKCGLIRSNSPFSYSNHRPAKPKIPKPLVYAQVSPLGTSFATP